MDEIIFVYLEWQGQMHLTGRLWTRTRKNRETASFEYEPSWLSHPESFAIDPILTLNPGPFHTSPNQALFGCLKDSAPDRWGRTLMRRLERRQAEQRNETPRTLREIDYLLMVSDTARQGALRFSKTEGDPFLAPNTANQIPPLIYLPKLLSATERLIEEKNTDQDLKLLLAPGSSLGGARPKASVIDKDGSLCIAKFPHKDDEYDTVLWEALALKLARKAGILTPNWRIEWIGNKPILLLRRFDRQGKSRIPFISSMSLLNATDNETHSYLEIVDALRQYSAAPKEDMRALWHRMVFNILIANTDDHLRNHGFLRLSPTGWQLSPVYDLNPVPMDIKPRILSTCISLDDNTGSLDLAMEVATYFDLPIKEASNILNQTKAVVEHWRQEAHQLNLPAELIKRMASAFMTG